MITIDPDGYFDEANISNAFPGVTLSANGGDSTSSNVYSKEVWCSFEQGFGFESSSGITSRFDQSSVNLRVDFVNPADYVEVDTIAATIPGPTSLGFAMRPMLQQGGITLTAYDSSGSVVDQDTASYGLTTLSVSTQGDEIAEIAYVILSHNGNAGDCYGIMAIRYHMKNVVSICERDTTIYGMARIDEQLVGYGQPGRDEIRQADNSLLPMLHDVDGNGYDTYLIIDIQTYENETWYGLFLGGCEPVYVPAEKVTRLY
ncbi:MAG: hypothetical protein CUN56_12770 [Phototrophicales bacterium]|nr:MAG: hypothetical protein CUN56_12770 [Phototrophicales bacterium]